MFGHQGSRATALLQMSGGVQDFFSMLSEATATGGSGFFTTQTMGIARGDNFVDLSAPPPPRGLPQTLINLLRVRDLREKEKADGVASPEEGELVSVFSDDAADAGDSQPEDDCCTICLEGMTPHGNGCVRDLPCGHTFHVGCVDKWFHDNITCPVCRAKAYDIREVEERGLHRLPEVRDMLDSVARDEEAQVLRQRRRDELSRATAAPPRPPRAAAAAIHSEDDSEDDMYDPPGGMAWNPGQDDPEREFRVVAVASPLPFPTMGVRTRLSDDVPSHFLRGGPGARTPHFPPGGPRNAAAPQEQTAAARPRLPEHFARLLDRPMRDLGECPLATLLSSSV